MRLRLNGERHAPTSIDVVEGRSEAETRALDAAHEAVVNADVLCATATRWCTSTAYELIVQRHRPWHRT